MQRSVALVEGWKSVNTNPADYSAHRLLADSYSILPRHEIARVSELLQSQLLQPLNVNPVQPQLAESNLFILEGAGPATPAFNLEGAGPATPAFNEFNALFTRNRLTLQTSGTLGSNDAFGDEVVHSGLWNKVSYSVGQFHYETDGFRENNDVQVDLVNGFLQASLSPKLSVQAEVRHREVDHGFLDLFADSSFETIDPNRRRTTTTDTVRAGAHYTIDQHSDLIGSFIHQEGDDFNAFGFLDEEGDLRVFRDPSSTLGNFGEAQYLFRTERFSAVAGGGYSSSGFTPSDSSARRTSHANGYLYSYFHYPHNVTWTFGVSFDFLKNDRLGHFDHANPKLGLIWRASPNTTVRLAGFRTLNKRLLTNQTIEPTQVAGFNQFFDDFVAVETRRYGIAVDHKFNLRLYGGLEASARELKIPRAGTAGTESGDLDERFYRAYLDWTPNDRISATLAYELDDFEAAESITDLFPETTTTHRVEAGLRSFGVLLAHRC